MVSPDVALQRKAVFRCTRLLAPNDPATPKMNEWLNGTPDSSPFKRAEKEMVSVEIKTGHPANARHLASRVGGNHARPPRHAERAARHLRALVTTYIAEVTPNTTDEQLRNNPLSIYVRDYSWSRI
jgi:type IV secretory pathway TrbF-like protein